MDVFSEGVEVKSEAGLLVEVFELSFLSFHASELWSVPGCRATEGDSSFASGRDDVKAGRESGVIQVNGVCVFFRGKGKSSVNGVSQLKCELCWGAGGEFVEVNGRCFGWAVLRDVNVEDDCKVFRDVKVMAGDVGDGYVG